MIKFIFLIIGTICLAQKRRDIHYQYPYLYYDEYLVSPVFIPSISIDFCYEREKMMMKENITCNTYFCKNGTIKFYDTKFDHYSLHTYCEYCNSSTINRSIDFKSCINWENDYCNDEYCDKKGEGIHHVAYAVTDIKAEMQRLKDEGFTLLNEEPKKGADNKWICFVHPKDANGVLVELCQERDAE